MEDAFTDLYKTIADLRRQLGEREDELKAAWIAHGLLKEELQEAQRDVERKVEDILLPRCFVCNELLDKVPVPEILPTCSDCGEGGEAMEDREG